MMEFLIKLYTFFTLVFLVFLFFFIASSGWNIAREMILDIFGYEFEKPKTEEAKTNV